MMINIKNTTIVQPSEKSSKTRLWVSNVDLVVPRVYVETIYFFRPDGSSDFFRPNLVKEALSRTLVPYYPMAGRLRMNAKSGRREIECNDEGVLFVEAETTSVLDDFGDFAPTVKYKKLVPRVDAFKEISSLPLLLVQHTRFKCGAISLGIAIYHILADGFSVIQWINSWAGMARGLDLANCKPSIDRTILRARDPPSPKFQHVEYEPCPTLLTPHPTSVTLSTRTFIITRDLINSLKDKVNNNHTSFETLSAHIWHCVCKARGLPDAQLSKLYIPVDARSRPKLNVPLMYFGNAVFATTPVASVGELLSNPLAYTAKKIRESVTKMDDEYMRSALDYIDMHPDKEALVRGPHTYKSPNLFISSLTQLPIYDADFGWGPPDTVVRGWEETDGNCILAAAPPGTADGRLRMLITLEANHMQRFQTYLYQIRSSL